MPLFDMQEMLLHARDHRYALAVYELVDLSSLRRVLDVAHRLAAPVVLGVPGARLSDEDIEMMMPSLEQAARRAPVPVAVIADGVDGADSAVLAIRQGCNGVVVTEDGDGGRTAEVVAMGRRCGVPVLGGPGSTEALAAFARSTGVTALCVPAGAALTSLRGNEDDVRPPLYLPAAGDRLDEAEYVRLISGGMTMVGCGLVADEARIESCLRACGAASRAQEVASACRPWLPVEHLIIYNVEGLDEPGVERMMAEGRRVLAGIPGVREVVTGRAVQEGAKYRYTWLVRFCHPAVIDSYREHPDHVAFADGLFRPVAGGRISIDYQVLEPEG